MDNSNQYIDLISKYLSKQTNADDECLLFNWIEKDKQNKALFDEFKKAWEFSETHFDPEINAIDIDEEWSKMELEMGKTKLIDIARKPRKFQLNWMQIAASITILILIGSGLFYAFSPKETILRAHRSVLEKTLPDGSTITLNQESNFTLTADFNKKFRKVKLEGEAYFKVKRDTIRPFIVKAGNLNVEVVGTSFYVITLEDSVHIQVIVESGIVKIYDSNNKSTTIALREGQSAKFNTETSRIVRSTSPDINEIAWKTKNFVFEEATFEQLVNKLNSCYNSEIIIKDESLKKCLVTVSFNNQSIESILKVLSATLDIQIEKKDKVIEISGNACETEKKE